MSAHRCHHCLTNWPPTTEFTECPECHERVSFMGGEDPIDVSEAMSRLRHAQFEEYYAEREAKRLADDLEALHRSTDPPGP